VPIWRLASPAASSRSPGLDHHLADGRGDCYPASRRVRDSLTRVCPHAGTCLISGIVNGLRWPIPAVLAPLPIKSAESCPTTREFGLRSGVIAVPAGNVHELSP